MSRQLAFWIVLGLLNLAPLCADEAWVKSGIYLTPGTLPGDFERVRKNMGERLTNTGNASVTLNGSLSDSAGTRAVTVTVQAPGYLALQDGSRSIAYDGVQWQSKNGKGGALDTQAQESLLAHLPESILLQLANNGTVRRIGSHFRTDNGKTPNYTGPYWTLYSFSPAARAGLSAGQALQQGYLVAIDEKTGLLAEVRIIIKSASPNLPPQVTQTKFNNWSQQGGQWFPGEIVRTENGLQTLKLTVQQMQVGPQQGISTFHP